ncbi:MAG: type II/IV secretion system protein, partial [Deltaproteobacteria bacterium]
QIQRKFNRPVEAIQINEYDLKQALAVGFGKGEESEEDGVYNIDTTSEFSFQERDVKQLVNATIASAFKRNASDIHIEVYRDTVDVRYRIDGVLHKFPTPIHKDNIEDVINRIRVMCRPELDITERRVPQDGRITIRRRAGRARKLVTLRVALNPGPYGIDCVLRVLDETNTFRLSDIGLRASAFEKFNNLIRSPQGLFLVTGPTGSGKSTTMYSIISELNTHENKIMSVEDPVERTFPGVNQRQISSSMSFADYVRSFLRQDPDIIFIGEIRDGETAEIATRAAQTGHLVVSTLHTNDATSAVSRLVSLGVERYLIESSILGVLAQRLLRKVCLNCIDEYQPEERYRKFLEAVGCSISTFLRGMGCEQCDGTGYRGRLGIFELFVVDEEIRDMIIRGVSDGEIRRRAIAKGMKTLVQDAIEQIAACRTTVEELFRTVSYAQIVAHTNAMRPVLDVPIQRPEPPEDPFDLELLGDIPIEDLEDASKV